MTDSATRKPPLLIRETVLALLCLAFGMFCLPGLIYLVGSRLIGSYEDGLGGFYLALADALAAANGFAWFLLLSPYVILLLCRAFLKLGKQRRS